jgi:hypothetical protein
MRIDPIEYVPAAQERGLQPNDDRRGKGFRPAPVEDEFGEMIKRTRRQAVEHERLSDGARNLFTWLMDASLRRSINRAPGIITVSTTKLSELLKRSKRAIYGWKKELVNTGFVWVTEWYMPNTWPISTYHISIIDPPDERLHQIVTGDGMWGNHARRPKLDAPGVGARASGQMSLSAQKHLQNPFRGTKVTMRKTLDSSKPQQNATGDGKEGVLSQAYIATDKGRFLRRGVAQKGTGESQKTTPGSRKEQHAAVAPNAPCPSHETAHIEKSQVPGNRGTKDSLSCLTAEEGATSVPTQQFSGSTALKRKGGETDFLEDLATTFARFNPAQAKKEMANWGGRWRNRYREDSAKAHRVLAELRGMVREGKINSNVGATADMLWKTFA